MWSSTSPQNDSSTSPTRGLRNQYPHSEENNNDDGFLTDKIGLLSKSIEPYSPLPKSFLLQLQQQKDVIMSKDHQLGRRRKRDQQVRFDDYVTVWNDTDDQFLSKQDRSNLWYRKRELQEFKNKDKTIIREYRFAKRPAQVDSPLYDCSAMVDNEGNYVDFDEEEKKKHQNRLRLEHEVVMNRKWLDFKTKGYCLRGLEDKLSIRSGLSCKARRVAVLQAVLDEQQLQRQLGLCNVIAIRRRSRSASKLSRQNAYDMGVQDARDIHDGEIHPIGGGGGSRYNHVPHRHCQSLCTNNGSNRIVSTGSIPERGGSDHSCSVTSTEVVLDGGDSDFVFAQHAAYDEKSMGETLVDLTDPTIKRINATHIKDTILGDSTSYSHKGSIQSATSPKQISSESFSLQKNLLLMPSTPRQRQRQALPTLSMSPLTSCSLLLSPSTIIPMEPLIRSNAPVIGSPKSGLRVDAQLRTIILDDANDDDDVDMITDQDDCSHSHGAGPAVAGA